VKKGHEYWAMGYEGAPLPHKIAFGTKLSVNNSSLPIKAANKQFVVRLRPAIAEASKGLG
jgi:hypothetical protein